MVVFNGIRRYNDLDSSGDDDIQLGRIDPPVSMSSVYVIADMTTTYHNVGASFAMYSLNGNCTADSIGSTGVKARSIAFGDVPKRMSAYSTADAT